MPPLSNPPTKSRHRWVIGVMLGIVLIAGVVNFIFNSGSEEKEEEALDYQIVDITIPPPPPPPPPDEETMEEPEDFEDLDDLAQSLEPMEMTSESVETSGPDIDIDIGDMPMSSGSGFALDIPRFGRRGADNGEGDNLLGGEMDSPPSPISKTQPVYPASLLKNGVTGKVLVSCTIDDTGRIVGTSIKSSSGHPDLDKAAITAVNKWKFKPGTKGGKKVKSVALVPFNFEVKK